MLERYSFQLERQVAELQEEKGLMQRALGTLQHALHERQAGAGGGGAMHLPPAGPLAMEPISGGIDTLQMFVTCLPVPCLRP